MATRSTLRFAGIAMALFLTSSAVMRSSGYDKVQDDTSKQMIAGHRVLRVYKGEDTKTRSQCFDTLLQDHLGRYWMAGIDELVVYDEEKDQWSLYPTMMGKIPDSPLDIIGQTSDKRIWIIGHERYNHAVLRCFNEDEDLLMHPSLGIPLEPSVRASILHKGFAGNNGRIWFTFSTKEGWDLAAFNGKDWDSRISLPKNRFQFNANLEDRDGEVWLATWRGILRLDKNKQWRSYKQFQSTPGKAIQRIYQDRKGRIWFADENYRATVYDKANDRWTQYNMLNYLPSLDKDPKMLSGKRVFFNVVAMYEDKSGQMMFGTSGGLITFLESEKRWEVWTEKNSGLPHDDMTDIFEDRSKRIWIATCGGIAVLEP